MNKFLNRSLCAVDETWTGANAPNQSEFWKKSHKGCKLPSPKLQKLNLTTRSSFFIIKGFRTVVFIFIIISTTFRPICPPALFRCLSISGTFTKLRTTSFIESTGVACSDSVSHNGVQVLRIPILLLSCSQD